MKKVNRLICIVCAVLLAVLLVGFNDAGDAAADEETDSSESSAGLETDGCDHYYRIAAYIYISTFEYWNYDLVCVKCGDRQTVSADITLEVVTEPSCTEDGTGIYTAAAQYNNQSFTVSVEGAIAASGHTEADPVTENLIEASCEEAGSYDIAVYCSVCGEELSRETFEIPAPGHNYEAVVTEPTCTEEGYITYTCTVCGNEYTDNYVEALGHTYEAAATYPTCTEEGYITYTCTVCGNTYIDDYVEALGHTYEAVVTEPTCTEEGYTTYTCIVCGYEYIDDYVDAAGHTYEAVVTEPTCIEEGYTTYTCIVCGYEYIDDYVDAAGHTYEAAVTEPTCTEEGYTTYTCIVCGYEYIDDYVNAAGHTYEAVVTEPTCIEEGYTTYTCIVCGYEYIDDYVDAAGHTYEAVVTEPTCTEEGYTTYTCTVCGNEYIDDYVEALGHIYEAVVTEPTCTEEGYITYTCSVCGDEYTASGEPAAGHSYGSVIGWNWSDDHTSCTAVFVCANDETHTQTVEADITVQTLESSLCTEPSVTTYTAAAVLDGEEYTNTYTETIVYDSHDYEILTTIEPTATEEGLIEYICTRCGYIYSETVPAIGTTDDEIIDSQQDLSDDRIDMELDGIPSPDDSEDDQPDDTEDTEKTESETATQEQSSETKSETEEETAESETEETASEAETETEVQTKEETETESEEETAAQPETGNAEEEGFSLSVSVGETVMFGSYEQDNNLSNGAEDIVWYAAAKEDGKVLLVSTYCLDVVSFGEETAEWEDSELNTWLNETFAEEAFTDEELEAVSEVFILSSDEVEEYSACGAAYATAYAKANGAAVYADGTSLYWTSDPVSIFRCAEVIRLVSGSSCADDFLSGIAVRAALWVVCE